MTDELETLKAENLALHAQVANLQLRLDQANEQHRMACGMLSQSASDRAEMAHQAQDAVALIRYVGKAHPDIDLRGIGIGRGVLWP